MSTTTTTKSNKVYKIELKRPWERRGMVLYRFGGLDEALRKWCVMERAVKSGVSGRRGTLCLKDPAGNVVEGIVVRRVKANEAGGVRAERVGAGVASG